jgi:DNA invertase Pin-like site-specific DNA recombinase
MPTGSRLQGCVACRSLADLANALKELHVAGRGLYLHVQGTDTTTPSGRVMFQMCGMFAELSAR